MCEREGVGVCQDACVEVRGKLGGAFPLSLDIRSRAQTHASSLI